MNAVVQPLFAPIMDTMRAHVEHLFGGYLDGCHDDHVIAAGIALTVNMENPPPKKIPFEKVTYVSNHADQDWMAV